MDALTFLYIALGVGFLILVAFLCTALVYCIRILRDITETTDKAKEVVNRINQYVVEPFLIFRELYENLKPFINIIQERKEDIEDTVKNVIHRKNK